MRPCPLAPLSLPSPLSPKTTLLLLATLLLPLPNALAQSPQPWKIKPLALDANEGCAIGDVDGDGSLDVVAGRHWYPAPDFIPRPLRSIEDWNGYTHSNGDFLYDVNGDGRLDVFAISFVQTKIQWFENPGPEALRLGQLWPTHDWVDTHLSENEAELFHDLDGDQLPEFIINSWNNKNPLLVWKIQRPPSLPNPASLVSARIADTGNSHGLGAGDLNGDGRIDLLTGAGWYEHPNQNAWEQTWKFHPDWQLPASIPMLVHDVDADGLADILVGQGHDYGLYWWRQTPNPQQNSLTFDKILIDKSFSQPHAMALADLDGDHLPELITGKRYFAHNGGDPGGRDMPILLAFHFDPTSKTWTRSVIEEGHVGVGLQVATGDLNHDGSTDIAVAGKSGTYLLFNPHSNANTPKKP